MKIGVRTPSVKKMTSSRTTGMINRKAKSSFNPLYGKSGMGIGNNPKKAIYNKVYNKTTVSIKDINIDIDIDMDNSEEDEYESYSKSKYNILYLLSGFLNIFCGVLLCSSSILLSGIGSFSIVLGILSIIKYIIIIISTKKPPQDRN